MSAAIIDGRAAAARIRQSLNPRIEALVKARGRAPRLSILSAAGDPSAAAYLQAKLKACRDSGIEADVHALSASAGHDEALDLLRRLGSDDAVDAVIVEFPLPKAVKAGEFIRELPAAKDVEGVTPENLGRLFMAKTFEEILSRKLIVPCTAMAAIGLLRQTGVPIAGRRAVVVGRSSIVGGPAAHLLTSLNATVTLCHSQTQDIEGELACADIVIAAIGRARFIKGSWLKKGAVVIDAGINRDGDSLCGDVDFEQASQVASLITPVPGGVGPVTTAMLLANTVALTESRL